MTFSKGQVFNEQFIVSQETQERFIDLFNDRNPLHTIEDFAVSKGFKGVVMHGNILNGFLSYFIGECLPLKNVIIHSQQIQYMNPCYRNEPLKFKAEVLEIFESVNAIEFRFEFVNKESRVVAKGKFQIGILK